MQEPRSFAYSLSQNEHGWRWAIYDENGVAVARGAHPSRDAAQSAVDSSLKTASACEPPAGAAA